MKPYQAPPSPADLRNMILTVVLCTGLLFIWQTMYRQPPAVKQPVEQTTPTNTNGVIVPGAAMGEGSLDTVSRDALLQNGARVTINSPAVHGSIALKGLHFDDLTLVRHRQELDPNSPEVVLLAPADYKERYFAQVGWVASTAGQVTVPNDNSVWQASGNELTPEHPITLSWTSPENIVFSVIVGIDKDYLFTIKQAVDNHSPHTVSLMPYGLLNREKPLSDRFSGIVHSGPLGVFDNTLTEVNYKALKEEPKQKFENTKGWLGIADKYWLTAFIPAQDEMFTANFQDITQGAHSRVQVDYLGATTLVGTEQSVENTVHLFAGAKELSVLERYKKDLHAPLFDRALDFGSLYFITKPIFITLDYFYKLLGNFGLAILLFVILLKIALFPLSNKSYYSVAQMRNLQPQVEKLKAQYENDKLKLQQEMMLLWQREKVNPLSGCLPMLIQIPIFFSFYKMLLVTIEMRHAPFYGWIHDLSAKDPTNVFTLLGLVEWSPPAMLHIGLWPIIMAATMAIQQKLQPKPTDPVQAKVIGLLPYIFLVMFAAFPAGLLIYWAWNNVLSIAQQSVIMRLTSRKQAKKQAANDA